MDTIAHLVIRVDGEGAAKAAENLEKTAKAAGKAEKAVDSLEDQKKRYAQSHLRSMDIEQRGLEKQLKTLSALDDTFKRNTQSYISISQKRAEAVDNAFKRNEQTFVLGEQRRAAAAIEAERKIQEARQQTIDKARLENRFSGAAGGWGGGGGGGGTINGVPFGDFGKPKGILSGVTVSNIATRVGPLATGLGIGFGLNEIKNTIIEMEVLEARLLTVAGSAERMRDMFSQLQVLDRQLPHDIKELTGAYINLVHLGLTPSEEALRSYSAISSASTKSIEDVVLAISRGVANDFRRIRGLGVEADVQGDKVKLTFNNISEVVDRTKEGLEGYFIKLGQSSTFAEASANKMKTLAGSVSNLESAWKGLILSISKGGVSEAVSKLIQGLTVVLDGWNYIFERFTRSAERAGEIAAHISEGKLKKARSGIVANLASSFTFGISDAYFEDKGPSAPLSAAKAPPPVLSPDDIAEELENNLKSIRDFKLKYSDEISRIFAEEEDELNAISNLKGLKDAEREELEEIVARRFQDKRKSFYDKQISEERKLHDEKIDHARKLKNEEEMVKRFAMGADEEGEIMAGYLKKEDWIRAHTKEGSNLQLKALQVANDKTLKELQDLANEKEKILYEALKNDEERINDAFKVGDINETERLSKSLEKRKKYLEDVSKISLGAGKITAKPRSLDPMARDPFSAFEDDLMGGDRKIIDYQRSALAAIEAEEAASGRNLEAIRKAVDDKVLSMTISNADALVQAEVERHENRNRQIADLRDTDLADNADYIAALTEEHETHQENLERIGKAGTRRVAVDQMKMQLYVLDAASGITAQLSTLSEGNEDAMKAAFFATKAIAIAQGIINTHLAATQALTLGPILGIPAAAFITGVGYTNVALMAATSFQEYAGKFADGGIVPGTSLSGDNLVARVNSGEMILNSGQQKSLFEMANGRMGGGSGVTVNVYNEAGVEVETQTREDGKTIDLIIRRVKTELATDAKTGKSGLVSVLEQTHGIRRRGA